MEKTSTKNGLTVTAYQGDAMTLLAFDLAADQTEGFVGFTIRAKPEAGKAYYLWNRITFSDKILAKNGIDAKKARSTEFSPIQKYRWIHVPNPDRPGDDAPWGTYTYSVTPRYMKKGMLEPMDKTRTVDVKIGVCPYDKDGVKIGFARGFVASQAYVNKFGSDDRIRYNKDDLMFDVNSTLCYNPKTKKDDTRKFTYEQQHSWMGWQARRRILELLDETIDQGLSLDVFAYDFDEPLIAQKMLELARKGRLRMILDNSNDGETAGRFKAQWVDLFNQKAGKKSVLERGKFGALAHSKIFIQRKGKTALKVLTGSTNFSTNGIYINNNHVLVFSNPKVTSLYLKVFEASLGADNMKAFNKSEWATKDHVVEIEAHPKMTIRFSPHPKAFANSFFKVISKRIDAAKSDLLFAIMDDDSNSDILDSVSKSIKRDDIFAYGITDNTSGIQLYAPGTKKGVRVTGKGINSQLPPPFKEEPTIDGHNIHHKFVVVDFKGPNPVVYCGSSNLALLPEQKNGDNLLEIRDRDVVTAFAIEAIRLVDHFQFRNRKKKDTEEKGAVMLHDDLTPGAIAWYKRYYDPADLLCIERTKLAAEVIA